MKLKRTRQGLPKSILEQTILLPTIVSDCYSLTNIMVHLDFACNQLVPIATV